MSLAKQGEQKQSKDGYNDDKHRESKDDENCDVTSLLAQQCRATSYTDLKAEQREHRESKDDENDDVTRISTRNNAALQFVLT
jgi:hypothetical protein